jgi:hypothetical protein
VNASDLASSTAMVNKWRAFFIIPRFQFESNSVQKPREPGPDCEGLIGPSYKKWKMIWQCLDFHDRIGMSHVFAQRKHIWKLIARLLCKSGVRTRPGYIQIIIPTINLDFSDSIFEYRCMRVK